VNFEDNIDSTGETKPNPSEKGKPKGKGNLKLYGIFLFGSMVVVFLTVWLSVSRLRQSQSVEDPTNEDVGLDSLSIDSAQGTENLVHDSTDVLIEGLTDQSYNGEILEQMAWMQGELTANQNQMNEIVNLLENQKNNTGQMEVLQQENEQKDKNLKYYQETLPESIAKKLTEYQEAVLAQSAKDEGSRGAQGRTADRRGATREGSGSSAETNAGVRQLAKIYESMRPENAAPILEKLEEYEIVNILSRMRQRAAGKILARLDPDLAARISHRIGAK